MACGGHVLDVAKATLAVQRDLLRRREEADDIAAAAAIVARSRQLQPDFVTDHERIGTTP